LTGFIWKWSLLQTPLVMPSPKALWFGSFQAVNSGTPLHVVRNAAMAAA